MRFRPLVPPATLIVGALLIVLSCFHYYTAGFGLLRETTHRGIHLAFVLGLVFLVFPARKSMLEVARRHSWLAPGGVPLVDWVLGLAIAASVLYIPWIFEDLAFRVGNPLPIDVVMGSILVVLLLEATRRAMGWPLPVIAIVFMVYALAGPVFPGPAQAFRRAVVEPRQSPLPDEPGHLRHRGRRGRDLRLPLRAVRRARDAHRPRASSSSTSRRRSPGATPAVRRR